MRKACLGRFTPFGAGVPQNYSEAADWYRRAAEQGHVDAQVSLGQLYQTGRGVPLDVEQLRLGFARLQSRATQMLNSAWHRSTMKAKA